MKATKTTFTKVYETKVGSQVHLRSSKNPVSGKEFFYLEECSGNLTSGVKRISEARFKELKAELELNTEVIKLNEVTEGNYLLIEGASFLVESIYSRYRSINEAGEINIHYLMNSERGSMTVENPEGERIFLTNESKIVRINSAKETPEENELTVGQEYTYETIVDYARRNKHALTSTGTGNNNEGGEVLILTKTGTNSIITGLLVDSEVGLFRIVFNKKN